MTRAPTEGRSILRTLHTVRYLKAVQVTNRVARRIRSRPRLVSDETAALRLRLPEVPCIMPPKHLDGGFRFHHRFVPFGGGDRWHPAGVSRLWTYHLHYFRYVHAMDVAEAWGLIDDWMMDNPPWHGAGWEPYTLSLRIREWIEWTLAHPDLPARSRERVIASLVLQVQALAAQLEYHLLGNHLLENAITLCWAGLSLQTPLADAWLAEGWRLLEQELRVQVLDDGSHDERSPMYQASIAESLLRLARVAADSDGAVAARAARAAEQAGLALAMSLAQLSHPDGEIALLNDAAFGEAPTVADLARRFNLHTTSPAPGCWSLPQAGYIGWRGPETWLVFDAGPIGPDHQPGHGHADTLSFELSHRGQRLITDTGAMTYTPGPTRNYDRGTAAHNTLEVDGRDQCELWGAFRCGRRVRTGTPACASHHGELALDGRYTGPGTGVGAISHERRIRIKDSMLRFADRIGAPGPHEAALRLHLAPSIEAVRSGRGVRLGHDGRPLAEINGAFEWSILDSPYHPEFGLELGRRCLRADFRFRDQWAAEWSLQLI